jgi:Rrf2 family iron-sulfur cluster assembly transcriptional regulator
MRVTNRSIHAVEALALLALGDPRKPRTVQSISDTVGISVSYTEQIFATLRSAGFVRAEKGPGGGYYLSEPADEIRVADTYLRCTRSEIIGMPCPNLV